MASASIDHLSLPPAPRDLQQIEALHHLLGQQGHARLVGPGGEPSIELPEPVYALLMQILDAMRHGSALSLVPVTQDLTTQEAAELLGVSRPYFVKLLEFGSLPFHLTGTHRRVYLNDLLTYKQQRDEGRTEALNRMAAEAERSGLYGQVILPSTS